MRIYLVSLTLVVLLFEVSFALGNVRREQSTFNADPSERLARPISVPDGVLEILSKDETVAACEKDNPILEGSSLASWFAASQIHLDGPSEDDLVVLPVAQGNPSMCFHSVEGIGWFWVFRLNEGRYNLILKTAGLSLSVLDSRHEGYKDIRSGGQVGKWSTGATFRFDGRTYQEYTKKVEEMR